MGLLGLFIDLTLPGDYDPGVYSASNRNEYRGYLLEGKYGRYVGMTTLLPSWAVWEPEGPVHSCTGIALYFNSL